MNNINPFMKTTFYTHLLKTTIAHLLLQLNIPRVTSTVLHILSDLLQHYIRYLIRSSQPYPLSNLLSKLSNREKRKFLSYLHSQKRHKPHFQIEVVGENEKFETHVENPIIKKKQEINERLKMFIKMGKELSHKISVQNQNQSNKTSTSFQIPENNNAQSNTSQFDNINYNTIVPYKIRKCPNRLQITKKEYGELMNWRKNRDNTGMVTDELLFFCKRVVEKE